MATDDEPDSLGPARPLLATALLLGGKAFAAGDAVGCVELCACAARLARRIKGLGEVADFRLEQALDRLQDDDEPNEQAAAIRGAFEDLLGDEEAADSPKADGENPLSAMQRYIEMAISIGAPAYNTGDHEGCYQVYSCTARMILANIDKPEPARAKLRDALNTCALQEDPNEQAWTMRHAFDAVAEMGDGPPLTPRDVLLHLSFAIRIGAPAFNAGDHRGCYEVYACTARFLINIPSVSDKLKDVLRAALQQASVVQNVSRQAWIMREAFDSLLPDTDDETKEPESSE
jgi:hypothetical protein